MRLMLTLRIVLIASFIGLVGFSLWSLRQPLTKGFRSVGVSPIQQLLPSALQPKGDSFQFVVVGDSHGVNPVYEQILKTVQNQPYTFLLNLADTTEFGRADEFAAVKKAEQQLTFPVYHTVGNHDIKAGPSRQIFAQAFEQQPCQSFDHGSLHLIILDNADRRAGFSNQCLNWLQADLAKQTDKTLAIAYHRPFNLPLGNVFGDDETTASRRSNQRFLEIVKAYPIKQMFTAHIHTYLSYTLAGIPTVISGGGGDPAQTILGGPASNYFHYLVVTVKNGQISTDVQRVQLQTATE